MISKIDTGEGRFPLVYAVMHDGTFVEGSEPFDRRRCHEANFIVILKDGGFYVWKDRDGCPGPDSFASIWKRMSAMQRRSYKAWNKPRICKNCGVDERSATCCFFRS